MRQWMVTLRINSKMSKRDASTVMKISESYYNLIEKGERQNKMDLLMAEKIAKTFGVSISRVVNAELKYRHRQIKENGEMTR